MSMTKVAPYGSWRSPITSDLIVAQSIGLSEARIDGGKVYWLEGRPQEQGRSVIVGAAAGGATATDLTPPPFNVRTRVHEYGAGAWTVADGVVYFSDFADGRLYSKAGAARLRALTPAPPKRHQWRFADGVIDKTRKRWIGVREDHSGRGEPVNAIVAVGLARPGREPGRVLVGGHDFFSTPRLSPDGKKVLWLAWDHPNMPWNGTTLFLAGVDAGGNVQDAHEIAGGASESIFQPEWSLDGRAILFVSDRSNWWNLYRYELATRATEPLAPMVAEFGVPQWTFGASTYACAGPNLLLCSYNKDGLGRLALLDLKSKKLQPLKLPFTDFGSVRALGQSALFRAGAADHPPCIVSMNLRTGAFKVLRKSTALLERAGLRIPDYLT